MRAAIFSGPGTAEVGERPDPVIREPADAVVRVVLGCVCGSDLWYYRGESTHATGSIGHEFIGTVERTGAGVRGIQPGDLVVHPFTYSDMPALPERVDHLLSRKRQLRQRPDRRWPG